MSDRTHEFQSLLQTVSASTGKSLKSAPKYPDPYSSQASTSSKNKNAFNEVASDIARGVHKTSAMLAKLTNLVRKQGLFDDPTDEINTLIYKIKQDLDELNTKCETAQQFIDSKKSIFGDNSSQSSQHNTRVVSHLKTDLLSTTKDFKTVLELRSNKMKDQQQRKVELVGKSHLSPTRQIEEGGSSKAAASTAPSSSSSLGSESFLNQSQSNSLVRRNKKSSLVNPYASFTEESGDSSVAVGFAEEQRLQQRGLLLEPITADTQYYDAREQAVTEVEKTINELGGLFKRLATMLQAQQELIERIDDDVENAVADTENAKNALLKAYESVSSNRGMYMKIGAILIVFFLIFVLFMM